MYTRDLYLHSIYKNLATCIVATSPALSTPPREYAGAPATGRPAGGARAHATGYPGVYDGGGRRGDVVRHHPPRGLPGGDPQRRSGGAGQQSVPTRGGRAPHHLSG
eukprot:1195629-Prorocentrum_minimum.AAC.2